jgi:glutamate 5-kinase
VGLVAVAGEFDRGDTVRVVMQNIKDTADGTEIARGIVNYDSRDLVRILRKPSDEIESILGYYFGDEVIHHNNLALL